MELFVFPRTFINFVAQTRHLRTSPSATFKPIMKSHNNILKYPITLALFILFMVLVDALFGKATEKSFWNHFIEGVAFLTAMLIADIAEKQGWSTWSGLRSKFKKKN